MTTFRLTDGRQVRAVRAILGMTQREMRKAAEVDRSTVCRTEKQGRLPPRSYAAERLGRFAAEQGIRCQMTDGKPAVLIVGADERTAEAGRHELQMKREECAARIAIERAERGQV